MQQGELRLGGDWGVGGDRGEKSGSWGLGQEATEQAVASAMLRGWSLCSLLVYLEAEMSVQNVRVSLPVGEACIV